MEIKQIIHEIKNRLDQPDHRAAYDVHALISNNLRHFKGRIADDDLRVIMADLETLSETSPVNYSTESYRRETGQVLNRLRFYLDRIL